MSDFVFLFIKNHTYYLYKIELMYIIINSQCVRVLDILKIHQFRGRVGMYDTLMKSETVQLYGRAKSGTRPVVVEL